VNTRALIFAIWIAASKSRASTITALETMASGQLSVFTKGGRTMVSSSVGSESFSFALAGALSPDAVQGMAYDGWRAVQRLTTDAELTEWLKADDVACTRVSFERMDDL